MISQGMQLQLAQLIVGDWNRRRQETGFLLSEVLVKKQKT